MTDLPTGLLVFVGLPVATLVIGWWITVVIAFVHIIQTAHLKDDEENDA